MPKPTEQEKKTKATEEKIQTKMKTPDGKEHDVEVVAKTKPNAQGGYDTEIHVPTGVIGIRPQKPGG